MKQAYGGIIINERETSALSDYMVDFLFNRFKECPYLDYKWFFNLEKGSNFLKIIKHIFAFSNYGGGWILTGWKEEPKGKYQPVGHPDEYSADQAIIQEKFNAYCDEQLHLEYKEFERKINDESRRFGLLFIPPSTKILKPKKDGILTIGDKKKNIFKKNDIYYRRGSQCIHPSKKEMNIIEKRLLDENYRQSLLSGNADNITEFLQSNLFELKKIPEYVYLGKKRELDHVSIKILLKQENIFPEWIPKFRFYKDEVVIFENLEDMDNPYRKLVDIKTIRKERISAWLENINKKNIIVSLLNKEVIHYLVNKGLFYSFEKEKFYFPCEEYSRTEQWSSKYRKNSLRQVAKKSYANQLHQNVFYHHCVSAKIIEIQETTFCLMLVPSFLLTEDGKKPISSLKAGTFITRLAYNQFNDKYVNNILFWIDKFSNSEKNIFIRKNMVIDSKSIEVEIDKGILFDVPSTEMSFEKKNEVLENED